MLIIILCLLIISARKHYTVDIVVSLYTTPLVYYFSFQIKLNVKTKLFRYIVFLPDVTTITLVFGTGGCPAIDRANVITRFTIADHVQRTARANNTRREKWEMIAVIVHRVVKSNILWQRHLACTKKLPSWLMDQWTAIFSSLTSSSAWCLHLSRATLL